MSFFKKLVDTFVLPKDENEVKAGELHYVSPEGKMEIHAVISGEREKREIQKIMDIMLNSPRYYVEDVEFDIGRTD